MSTYDDYNDARGLVLEGLDNILSGAHEDETEEPVRSIHVQSIVYRLMDQV